MAVGRHIGGWDAPTGQNVKSVKTTLRITQHHSIVHQMLWGVLRNQCLRNEICQISHLENVIGLHLRQRQWNSERACGDHIKPER